MTMANAGHSAAHLFYGRPWSDPIFPLLRLSDILRKHAMRQGGEPFLTVTGIRGKGETLSYQQTWDSVNRAAAFLSTEMSIGPAARVAVAPKNDASAIVSILALRLLGATCVLLNPHDPKERSAEQVRASRAECVLVHESQDLPGVPIEKVYRDSRRFVDRSPSVGESDSPTAEAFILFTTGTTSSSKAVVQSAYNVFLNSIVLAHHHALGVGRRLFGVLPISYANGLELSILATLIAGGHVVLSESFDPLAYLGQVDAYQAHVASVVPSILSSVCEARRVPALESLEYFISAAAPLRSQTARRTMDRLGKRVVQGYGLTETTNFSTSMPTRVDLRTYSDWCLEAEIPAVGVELPGVEVAVLDPSGNAVPDGEEGEVCMRGHSVMLGYDRADGANRAAFKHGWFHSGDVGVLKDDPRAGGRVLTLRGRLKNIVKVGGAAVSLDELDRALLSIRGVADAMAVGEADERTGERVALLVVEADGVQVDDLEIHAAAARVLPKGVRPWSIRRVDSVPRTPNGKAMRKGTALGGESPSGTHGGGPGWILRAQ